ncbi:MAG: autotransporter-associated beta strand repeat-containing protein [Rariglobus sp.]
MKTTRYPLHKSRLVITGLVAAGLLSGSSLLAADTLSSTATGTSVAWGTTTNWLDGSIPISTDDVLIDYSNGATTPVLTLNAAQAANSLTFGSATGTALGSFTLRANTSVTTGRTLTLTSGAITVDSSVTGQINLGTPSSAGFGVTTIVLPNNSAFTSFFSVATGKTLNIDAVLSGTGTAITLQGGGTVVFAGANTFGASSRLITTSTTAGSLLAINNAGALGNSLNILNLSTGSTIDNTSGAAITLNNTNGIRVNGTFTFAGTQDLTFNGAVDLRSGNRTITTTAGTLTLNGALASGTGLTKAGAGKLVLGGAGSYTGTTTISGGTLQLGDGGATGSLLTTGTIVNNANLTINRNNAVVQGTDFSSTAISGTGSFTQAGTGTTTLNVANSYTGVTTVNAGTLSLAVTGAILNSATNDIILGGGTLQSALSQNLNLATLSLTAGTASILDLSTGGTFDFANSASSTWGIGSTLSIVGTFSATSVRFGTDGNGLTGGQLSQITINGQLAEINSNGFLAISSVPEPATVALVAGLSVLGLSAIRRRRTA